MEKSTIDGGSFHSYVKLPEGKWFLDSQIFRDDLQEAADTPAVIRHEPLEPEGIVTSTINTITWLFR